MFRYRRCKIPKLQTHLKANFHSKPEGPNSTELHRGFGYVEFEDPEDTKEAIDNMDQSELFGRVIKVSAAKPPKNANEGLGSKTALWEQVPYFAFAVYSEIYCIRSCANLNLRKAGWQRMLSVMRTS
jgi:RNA recognition motif-containing protein